MFELGKELAQSITAGATPLKRRQQAHAPLCRAWQPMWKGYGPIKIAWGEGCVCHPAPSTATFLRSHTGARKRLSYLLDALP